MVSLKEIQTSNSKIDESNIPQISVFAGGTSGIGRLTLSELVKTGLKTKIYLIGRASSAARTQSLISELQTLNRKVDIIWLEGEVSLLADVKRICSDIEAKESRLDLLYLSAGYPPWSGRRETSEGIEISQSLQYYSRVAFITRLLPLLRQSPEARVVSVLGGGMERANIDVEDLALKKPGAFGGIRSELHVIAMNTMTMEKLADDEKSITFIHAFPGQVNTGNLRADLSPGSVQAWLVKLLVEPLIRIIGFSDKESGERNLFICTSDMFGGNGVSAELKPGVNTRENTGPGLFLVNQRCDSVPNKKVIENLRARAQRKIWIHTEEVIQPTR